VAADDYSTPAHVWRELVQTWPRLKMKRVWDPFYNDGLSKKFMHDAGIQRVVHKNVDFFNNVDDVECDLILTNPPFSIKKRIIQTLMSSGKAFIMLVPAATLFTEYFAEYRRHIKIIMPKKRIHYIRNGQPTNRANFDSVFICHKTGPRAPITWM
jgi:hypothetical protein